jgi:hypothetical protein
MSDQMSSSLGVDRWLKETFHSECVVVDSSTLRIDVSSWLDIIDASILQRCCSSYKNIILSFQHVHDISEDVVRLLADTIGSKLSGLCLDSCSKSVFHQLLKFGIHKRAEVNLLSLKQAGYIDDFFVELIGKRFGSSLTEIELTNAKLPIMDYFNSVNAVNYCIH